MIHVNNMRELIAGLTGRFLVGWSWVRDRAVIKAVDPVVEVPKPISVADQWKALEDYLRTDMIRAQSVLQMQDTATLHLDAAHYALDRIAVELVDVMPSIMTVATVRPPRIYAPQERAVPVAVDVTDQSIAA